MGRIEDLRQLHSNCGEIVHVEEASIIDLFCGDSPERETIRLVVKQQVERIEASRISRPAVDHSHGLRDRSLNLDRILAAPLEPALDDFFLARPFRDPFRIGFRTARQVFQSSNDALELRVKLFIRPRRKYSEGDLEDVAIGPGRDREFMIMIAEKKSARLEVHS